MKVQQKGINTKIVAALRKIWMFYSSERKATLIKENGGYECMNCSKLYNTQAEMVVDHIDPIMPLIPDDEFSYDTFIHRLFCGRNNLQMLCKGCSKMKTELENKTRNLHKQKKKNDMKYQEFKAKFPHLNVRKVKGDKAYVLEGGLIQEYTLKGVKKKKKPSKVEDSDVDD